MQAFPSPPMHAPDYYAGEVADELFSGMASRLFERVREEKGLAYFVRSSRVTGLDAAMFSFLAGTQPGREAEVLAEIDAEIARVQAGEVEAAELLRCQTRLGPARRQSLQGNAARGFYAGLNVLQGQRRQRLAELRRPRRRDHPRRGLSPLRPGSYFQRSRRTQLVVQPGT